MADRFDVPDEAQMINECLPALALVRMRNAKFKRPRPAGGKITEIVLHDTDSGTTKYANTVNYLANPGDGRSVSIHYIIGRDAGEILAMVPEEMVANQARSHNDYSIGIELWRNHKQYGYTAWQYDAVSQLVFDIRRRHGIPRDNVVGHGSFEKSRPPQEPEGFEWSRLDDDLDRLQARVKAFDPRFAL
ncbi:MAG: N-acetylmuramoyl-L-alanine amidase [Rubrivivax sp.]|nr:N-acetylmuramoyl-L-alanine amidase [Rubrivivax sp.]MBK7262670.1 N-acetylmuramoyl-L-alanine amidase [Rubrivivax sp.]MBK8527378.1 N-acetylmuramoyl-L-alanine amidase [Rubrivivax sp.]